MNIETKKIKGWWYADFSELAGSPFVGTGETEAIAIACLFIRNIKNIERLNNHNPILKINGVVWKEAK